MLKKDSKTGKRKREDVKTDYKLRESEIRYDDCYYHSKEVEEMLSDIHDFMLVKKEQNGSRDTALLEHRKELNGIHKDIKELSAKVGLATVMGAITLAVLAAFLSVTTYLIIQHFMIH